VIFDRFNHHGMLLAGALYLHAPGPPNPRMGDIAVAGDFVRGVNHHNALAEL
jgi:hypothetical protein